MDFRFTAEQERFREEVRSFLADELADDSSDEDEFGSGWSPSFSRKLADRGWIALPWPKEYGGQAASHMMQVIFNEEMASHRAPAGAHRRGVFYVGPVLMLHGTEEQRRELLPRITAGEAFFCQGFSEPGAGSDAASIQTRAVRDGDDYVINGQKIWTSDGHRADYVYLTARTDPNAPKHRGISNFIVDLRSPGITVSPLVNLADVHSFNQVFYDNVRVPARNLVGEENRGWYVAAALLDFERSSIAGVANQRLMLDELVAYAKDLARAGRLTSHLAAIRAELAQRAIEVEVGRIMSYTIASIQDRGQVPNREASASKLFTSELSQRMAQTGMRLLGLAGQVQPGSRWVPLQGRIERAYRSSVAATIGGGTSEIQRNVIATRGLGLPRG
jgi:alkylation response protein AidB-like acyl-CoA dehydrogenase